MTKTLKMELTLTNAKKLTLSLANPKDGLTRAEVEAVLQTIIDKQLIINGDATPKAVNRIYVETNEETDVA